MFLVVLVEELGIELVFFLFVVEFFGVIFVILVEMD